MATPDRPAAPARPRSSLRQRILLGLFGYTALLSIAVVVQGFFVNEHAEHLVWTSLMNTEMDYFVERSRSDPDYRWSDTQALSLYDSATRPPPRELAALAPGVHDEVVVAGVEYVTLVRDIDGRRLTLALDIDDMEHREFDLALTIAGSAVTTLLLLGVVIGWGVRRLVRPLTNMAQRIGGLRPDRSGQRVDVPESASSELVVIADAVNDYLQRNDRFVERERAFIDSASHELRTPISVIAGAAEIALEQNELPAGARHQINRIRRASRDVEQLISLLLVLAKDPKRLSASSDRVALDHLLPEIVEDHRHLTRDKDLTLAVAPLPPCEILAPLPIVQAAIGNLLRNAIENSDRGEIAIRLHPDATVTIDDPGHGMTPEEISAIYARVARGGREGGGIGLDLISRLCEHLGWTLRFDKAERGTRTTLALKATG
ncbi:sensor histidine kinase [Lysobacter enzymogenes]|uniref:histidine kinase n=1 Tax=Lysobacter enzymogenes TaxID=69 RepID=A0A0S2DNV3_LYSEN|nr:HAMP domain-containing sensor histidine kinase [Lysobacter enzymogenes]ALN60244.1 sensor histidine kinase [Lysobacter enzymogenes]QCW28221.1 HAMP domain-containing histidine kinase [Lysobacter enzymogenes]QQQ01776.1 HAMP domain-containing histidine kinase [Lysobacter enzymogenes]